MDKHMSSISNKIKPKIKTPTAKAIPTEKPATETEASEFKIKSIPESPKIASDDNNVISEFSSNFYVQHGINTLNINFPTCYHDRRPAPLQMPSKY